MDGSQQPTSGFPSHVQDQLNQAVTSVSQSNRGRGPPRRARSNHHHYPHHQQQQPFHHNYNNTGMQFGNQPTQQTWNVPTMANPTDQNSFPPLGASRPHVSASTHQTQYVPNQQQSARPGQAQQPSNPSSITPNQYNPQPPQSFRREYPVRGRGGYYRGGNQATSIRTNNQNQQQASWDQSSASNSNDYRRPPPAQNRLFAPNGQPYFGNSGQQREYQRRVMDQSDFLNHLASQSLTSTQLTTEEQQTKELFRKELETIAQKVVAEAKDLKFDPQRVQLKLYGSLGSGFGVAGCDMDLLLAFPQDIGPIGDIEIDSRRMLEKALLDAGIGARLLTNTRVPILRVCQRPGTDLLKNLRENRANWEKSLIESEPVSIDNDLELLSALTTAQINAAAEAFKALDLESEATEIPLPASPPPEHARLEYTDDCGIQCDINFSNYVALHNTRLLRTYGLSDHRVRQVGVFVKAWAKARDINTPYYGTLSSYGYVLMVLHYLMNVANPPVIPNLQDHAKNRWDGPTDRDLVEGFDVRFVNDMNEVKTIMESMPRNHESVGSLLRGFFNYYANPRGFHWNYDVVSIRTRGGQLNKRAKGWTEAKWSNENQSVRLRYLLAIEDPFELEHNVARTVGHSGIVAIRDEFRRAWTTIENIQFDNEAKLWLWTNDKGQRVNGDDLMARVEKRGDLLRKDQDYHRQKLRQMRQELEAKERALKDTNVNEAENVEETAQTGTFNMKAYHTMNDSLLSSLSADTTLIHRDASQVYEDSQPGLGSQAEVETRWQADSVETTLVSAEIDWDVSFTTAELGMEGDWQTKDDPTGTKPSDMANVHETSDSRFEAEMVEQTESTKIPASAAWRGSGAESPVKQERLPRIPWDNTTQYGRRLLWRDKKIRDGVWTESERNKHRFDKRFVELDQMFPYNPDMSITELAHKNEMLRTRSWLKTKEKVKQKQHNVSRPPTSVDIQPDTRPVASNSSKLYKSESVDESQKKQLNMKATYFLDDKSPGIESSPNQPQMVSTNMRHEADEAIDSKVVRGISPPHDIAPGTEAPRTPCENPDDPQSRGRSTSVMPNTSQVDSRTSHGHSEEPRPNPGLSTEANVSQPRPRSDMVLKQGPPAIYADLVPLTLLPAVPPAQRPRDEDSDVMPIPRQPNFAFDPRQLADLEIIRRGGNGCARAGEEYNIERDYEWGGGGELAGRSTSSGIEQLSGA